MGTFEDFPYPAMPSPMFGGVDMVDASGSYHIYGGSCFGFLVDTRKLEGKPVPRMWSDVLDPLYRDMVVCGFNIDDINDIVLLNIFRFFGTPGEKKDNVIVIPSDVVIYKGNDASCTIYDASCKGAHPVGGVPCGARCAGRLPKG